jgi:SAM-dependent methyltransferase
VIPDPADNIWEHSQNVRGLYRRRAEGEGEMDAAAQCAEILTPFIRRGAAPPSLMGADIAAPFIRQYAAPPRLLDAGCGSGYLWHSFKKRGLAVEYFGLDYSPSLIDIGREVLPRHGLEAERLTCGAIEDVCGQSYDIAVLLNTLTFCPDYREPLDRLMETGAKILIIRDNFGPETLRRWEIDGYLDPGYNHLKAYWNQWQTDEVVAFIAASGYQVTPIPDRRTGGRMEPVVDKPYYWSWLLAVKPVLPQEPASRSK